MKKSIFLFFAAILCAIGMNAATWTVAGDNAKILNGTSTWDPGDTKNDMTNVSGTKWGLLVMNKSLAKTTYKFKVCKDHGWGTAYPGSDYNFTIGAAGTYNIIYRFNTNGNTVKADYFKTWTVAGSGAVLGDDWKPEATANDMTRNGNTFEYVLTKKDVKLEKGTTYECKVCKDHAWGTAYPSQNQAFSVSTTGYYDVTFKFNVATETVTVTTTLISCKVTTSANPTEGGSVTATKEYAKGSSVTLTATPAEGYEFVNWTKEGSIVSTSKAYTFTVLEDVSLVANFKIPEPDVVKYQITVSANNPTMGTVTGSGEYEEGTTALLTATPNSGYLFKKWTVGGAEVSTANPYTFTVNADVTVVANFEETPKETVYFVNNGGWASVSIYGWGGSVIGTGINQWAGVPMTKTGETLTIGEKSYDIYSYSAEVGAVKNILFNYNGDANKTSDFVWTDGKYYYNGAAANYAGGTKEDIIEALAPAVTYDYYVIGTMNSWRLKDAAYGMELNGDVYEKEVALAIGKHELKINNGTWDNANTFGHDNLSVAYEGVSRGSGEGDNNIVIDLAEAKTVTVKLDKNTKKITLDGLTEKAPEPTFDYYIVGSFNGDDPKKAENGMTLDGTVYKATVTLAAGDNTLKVTKGSWDPTWGYNELGAAYEEVSDAGEYNNIKITLTAEKSITVIFDATAGKITFEGLTEKAPAEPAKCYLMGIGGDWTTGIEMEEDGDQFKLLCQPIAEGEQFKFKHGDTWSDGVENYDFPGIKWVDDDKDGNSNITLPAGNYNFYYKKATNQVYIAAATDCETEPETYTRTVTPGNYGTICLPYASSSYTGAEFYEVSWLQKSGETPVNLYLEQLADGNQLVAGKPYIFRATSSELTVTCTGDAVDAPIPADENNGLTGSFDAIPAGGVLTGNYVVAQNKFWTATADAYAAENRAYINATIVPTTEPAKVPGRRRVSLGAAGENAETGIDNIITTDTPVKVIENGQLIIIRNGERFNVQGQKL